MLPLWHRNEVPDIMKPGLRVLFCGINPGFRSAESGQHFARPGNRFWKVLHLSGFTERQLAPTEQWSLLDFGLGITNLVARSSAAAAELSRQELEAGAAELAAKVEQLQPRWIAFVGMQAYRTAFRRPKAAVGRQAETIGDHTGIWVLPNPSGLQARYQLPEMVSLFAALRDAADLMRVGRQRVQEGCGQSRPAQQQVRQVRMRLVVQKLRAVDPRCVKSARLEDDDRCG